MGKLGGIVPFIKGNGRPSVEAHFAAQRFMQASALAGKPMGKHAGGKAGQKRKPRRKRGRG